ncbi:MAG TPA: cache domain-containing protein [Burkholderiaceae bacterium]|nr:cache domain-containing protein [Burkholderiaceae bacterium]
MRLKAKLMLLAALPLLISLALIAATIRQQERELAQREHALVERTYMNARQAELRHYVELAISTVRPLYNTGRTDAATRQRALRLLASLDYGDDGYFFVYDLEGRSLMHSRQPELEGRNLWDLRDPDGSPTIQRLIERARNGGGFVRYTWRKPSTGQTAPKLGYVVALPRWNWMVGTGLYLDDIDTTLAELDRQVSDNVNETLVWIACIAALGIALISASGLWLNFSEHRAADAKLALLARKVVRSQEDERAHLSRELHDGTSQMLVSAKLLAESAADEIQNHRVAVPPTLTKALTRINDTLVEVRRISHRLRPAMLDTLGLPAALELLTREFNDLKQARATLKVEGSCDDLPEEINTILFRVAQEALANVAKHSHAEHVHIQLSLDEHGLSLEVVDDGVGFDTHAVQVDPHRGIGLRNMRERLESVDGHFEIHSHEDGMPGTTLRAFISAVSVARIEAAAG